MPRLLYVCETHLMYLFLKTAGEIWQNTRKYRFWEALPQWFYELLWKIRNSSIFWKNLTRFWRAIRSETYSSVVTRVDFTAYCTYKFSNNCKGSESFCKLSPNCIRRDAIWRAHNTKSEHNFLFHTFGRRIIKSFLRYEYADLPNTFGLEIKNWTFFCIGVYLR